MGYRIKRKERVHEGLRRIVREQLREAISAARDTELPQDERVHEVRTRLKRSRAALALIRGQAGARAKRDDRRLRDAARILSRPRDLAVQAHTFRVLGRLPSGLPPRLVSRLGAAEQQVRSSLDPKDVERDLRRAARVLRKMRRRLGGWRISHGRRAVGKGLARTYRAGRAGLKAARKRPSAKRLHDWRKQVKALSYELRIVGRAVPELMDTLCPKVERLADVLGEVHDLDGVKAAAERHPRWFGRAADGAAVLAAVDDRRAELEAEALELALSVFAGRVRDVRSLVETGWQIWRQAPKDPAPEGRPPALVAVGG